MASSVASIASLVELAIKSYSSAAKLAEDIHDAPRELSRVAQQLSILNCELALLSDIQKQTTEGDELLLLPNEAALLEDALSSADELMSEAQKQLDSRKIQTGNRARLTWVLKDKNRVDNLLHSLQQTETSLNTVLLLLNVRLSSYSWKVAASIRSKSIVPSLNANEAIQPEPSKLGKRETSLSSLLDRNPQAWNILFGSWRSWDHSWIARLGLQIILTCYGNSLHTSYFVSGKIGPWGLFGLRAICFDLGLRVFPLAIPGFSILGASLSLRNVVPETSEIILACQNGDTHAVRELFLSRRASSYDVTPENSTLMRYAIDSGSLELVTFLFCNGIDVNATFGIFNTSALEWAFNSRQIEIARYLLSYGARLDYLCSRGWTPVMHLFFPSKPPVPAEYLEMLCAKSFSDFDVQDQFGTTALHRAASWGTAEDVRLLLQAGASPSIFDNARGWTAVFDAVSEKNPNTLRELTKHMIPGTPSAVDFRGWTLLPIAIETGDLEIMRLVLELGVDPHYLVKLGTSDNASFDEVTPVEFSQQIGPEVHKTFLTALQLVGFDVSTAPDDQYDSFDDDGEGAVFWPAESGEESKRLLTS